MNRVEQKFMLAHELLPTFLGQCGAGYRVLELNGTRCAQYRTTYFDTADLSFYHAHLTGRMPRRKLRVRTYVDTHNSFLEIKCRDNHGRSKKARVEVPDSASGVADLHRLPEALVNGLGVNTLREVVTTAFNRITLVSPEASERVTIDSSLTFTSGDAAKSFSRVVYVEVKQAVRGPSRAMSVLGELRRRPGALSKYCVGVATVLPGSRTNRFRPLLRQLYRIERDDLLVADHA
jgi:hypothetical protein